ncbi:Pkinase-domain-containing protein [Favolaschia claudopus]|uniref:Pkinase-domain-containing protein n=1 Tax=Favolaschia claudopus TaxID=2862362 RepID=A0AAW0AYZ4_9AGAR
MDGDAYIEDLTQPQEDQTQTQPLTQSDPVESTEKLWGYLQPCRSLALHRVELEKIGPQIPVEVKIGRNPSNLVIFPGFKISNFHAIIRWNGEENAGSEIIIEDKSSNGTFVNGEKIGKGSHRLLKDGNEIAFGVATRSIEQDGLYDYRFIFRDLVSGVVKRALYNSYDLSTELGKGSFATVYKALHKASGEWVAVKVIHETKRQAGPTATINTEAKQAAQNINTSREINIMENLRHPNICQLREVFWNANGSIDLVLELIEGGDLLDFILKHGGLDENMSKHITFQLCQALAYIHEKGITHRDLKPENVLLTAHNPPIVKVADFGLAKIVDSMTMLKTMCGTPSYLAPEVVSQHNNSGYDSLVDSWSVGVILFSMISNTTPFIDSSDQDLRTRILTREIEWGQLDLKPLSDNVHDFIRRLLEFQPCDRMKLADALLHPWFEGYQLSHHLDYPQVHADGLTVSRSLSGDVSMRTAEQLSFNESVSQGIEHLKLNGSAGGSGLPPPTSTHEADTNGDAMEDGVDVQSTRSMTPPGLTELKKGGLHRRADILQHAADAGLKPAEPSPEMVNYLSQSQGQGYQEEEEEEEEPEPEAGSSALPPPPLSTSEPPSPNTELPPPPSSATSSNGKGPNKRVHSELTPLAEDMEDVIGNGVSGGSSPLSSLSDIPPAEPQRKKGRSTEDGQTTKAARGRRGTGATTRKGRTKADSNSAEEAQQQQQSPVATRRSTRTKAAKS